MRFTAAIPLPAALAIHRAFGTLLYYATPRRRRVVSRNIELCFPELSATERGVLVKGTFVSLGASFAECAIAWFTPARRLKDRFEIRGIEHLQRALENGNGVILYTGHFTSLEICGRPFKQLTPRFACMFSRRSNPLLDEIQRRGRLLIAHELVASDNVRSMLKSLKNNAVVWYAPDQADVDGGVLIPFFHELAMTNIATSKLARISGAAVVPFSYRRLSNEARYELRFHPPLRDFPTSDPVADTRRLVAWLEEFIRLCPEQYQWLHRRFKGRPAELVDLYKHRDNAVAEQHPTRTYVLPNDLECSIVIPLDNEEAKQ